MHEKKEGQKTGTSRPLGAKKQKEKKNNGIGRFPGGRGERFTNIGRGKIRKEVGGQLQKIGHGPATRRGGKAEKRPGAGGVRGGTKNERKNPVEGKRGTQNVYPSRYLERGLPTEKGQHGNSKRGSELP